MHTAFLVLLATIISASSRPRIYLIETKDGEVHQRRGELELQEDVREAPRRRNQLLSPWHDRFHKLRGEKEGRELESASQEIHSPQHEVASPTAELDHAEEPEEVQ